MLSDGCEMRLTLGLVNARAFVTFSLFVFSLVFFFLDFMIGRGGAGRGEMTLLC